MHMQIRRTAAAALAVTTALLAASCAGDDLAEDGGSDSGSGGGTSVTLATQDFPEAALVTAMYTEVLEAEGFSAETKTVGTRDVYMAEFPGEVDVVPEYIAGIADFLNIQANGADAKPITTNDPQESLDAVQPLLEEQGITLLEPSEASSQNAYFVTQEYSESEGVTKLSDLEGESVVLAAHPDCEGRSDCEAGLKDTYGIDITKLLPLGFASPQTYDAVLEGEADLGQTGTTDGTLESQGLVLLEDDKGIQPAQNLIPAVSTEFLDANPEIEQPLDELMAALDNETLGELIVRVSVDREKPEDVAREFLEEQGLV
jgi:osmoprotectant transport system substrate-binding protein